MNGDDYPLLFSPYSLVLPGVDYALALILRQRAEECLEASELTDGYIEANPNLLNAIDMDECYEFTREARAN